jgi:hypothetical protein
MDPRAVSRMLGLLKYKARGGGKKGVEQEDAQHALAVYTSMDPQGKRQFLLDFEAAGRGRTKGALKFALQYKRSLIGQEEKSVSTTEDYYTRGQIMSFNGFKWGDYEQAEALRLSDLLIEENKTEYNHEGLKREHPTEPLLTRFWYVRGGGVKKKQRALKEERLDQDALDDKDLAKILARPGASASSAGGASSVKKEAPDWDSFQAKAQLLKGSLHTLQKSHQAGVLLHSKYVVAGRKDEALRLKGMELGQKMEGLNTFIQQVLMKCAESDEMHEGSENLQAEAGALEALISTADHHIGGFKELARRCQAMLGEKK